MDTTEPFDGKYYFDGMSVDKEELLMWLILDEFMKTFSRITDILAVASMIPSLSVITVSGKLGAKMTSLDTSPLSILRRKLICAKFKNRRRTITYGSLMRDR
nr:hypothetical protein [Pantoea ananatis]